MDFWKSIEKLFEQIKANCFFEFDSQLWKWYLLGKKLGPCKIWRFWHPRKVQATIQICSPTSPISRNVSWVCNSIIWSAKYSRLEFYHCETVSGYPNLSKINFLFFLLFFYLFIDFHTDTVCVYLFTLSLLTHLSMFFYKHI